MIKWIKNIIYDMKYDNFIKVLRTHGFEKISKYDFVRERGTSTYKFNIKTNLIVINGKLREFHVENYSSVINDPVDLDHFLYRNMYYEPLTRMSLVK